MCEKEESVVNLVTSVAQAVEMAKSQIKSKRKENDSESMAGGKQKCKKCTATVDWIELI